MQAWLALGQLMLVCLFFSPLLTFFHHFLPTDVLLAHLVTWAVEELGPGCVERYPHIVDLQCEIISGPYLQRFIRSNSFYPIGDQKYVDQVSAVLGRKI